MIDDDSQLDHVPCSFHSRELKRIIALLLTCNSCLSQCIYNLATYLASTVVATVAIEPIAIVVKFDPKWLMLLLDSRTNP
jgi:hypothetical protein